MLGFQCLNEFGCVRKELGPWHREFLSQGVRDLIQGTPILQQLPNSEAHWVETETNPLFNVQQDRSVFRSGFPDAGCDRGV